MNLRHFTSSKAGEADARKLKVVNGPDGTWALFLDDKEIMKGNNMVDPTKKPKTIDFSPTEGEHQGKVFKGIYEIEEKKRTLCFAPPDGERPTEFVSMAGSEHVLVHFEREPAK